MDRFDKKIKDIDQKLESVAQQQVRNLVKEVQDEPLSMSWRSELNEKINAIAQKKNVRRRYGWMWRAGLGLGLAGGLTAMFMFNVPHVPRVTPSSIPASGGGLESKLVELHQKDAISVDVAGAGLSALEVTYDQTQGAYEPSWSELDLETL